MSDQSSQVPAQPQVTPLPSTQVAMPTVPTLVDEGRPNPGVISQALPTAVIQTQDPLNPVNPKPSAKETSPVMMVDQAVELPGGVQSVETLRTPEIPVEVEKFIEEVKDHPDQIPAEVVMTDQQQVMNNAQHALAKPVIILPMTKEELHNAKKSSPQMSKRWLGEWVEKIMKVFAGEVVFRDKQQP